MTLGPIKGQASAFSILLPLASHSLLKTFVQGSPFASVRSPLTSFESNLVFSALQLPLVFLVAIISAR